jgi:hypothetical protein
VATDDISALLRRADDAAASAQRSWLLATGLAAEVDDIRFQGEDGPVVAPGLDELRASADHSARNAAAAANRARALQGEDSMLEAVEDVERAATEGARAGRSLAQLALGVSAHLWPSERVDRLDRAAVSVLAPPGQTERLVPVSSDGFVMRGTRRAEWAVAVAGLISRLLVERCQAADFVGCDGRRVRVGVSSDDELLAWMASPDADLRRWRRWPSPITVSGVVRDILDLLVGSPAVDSVLQITVDWSDNGHWPDSPVCPRCTSADVMPLASGIPNPEVDAADHEKVVLAGRLDTGADPTWACGACDAVWGPGFAPMSRSECQLTRIDRGPVDRAGPKGSDVSSRGQDPESRRLLRVDFASDIDGDLHLIASPEETDAKDWIVRVNAKGGGRVADSGTERSFTPYWRAPKSGSTVWYVGGLDTIWVEVMVPGECRPRIYVHGRWRHHGDTKPPYPPEPVLGVDWA